MSKIIVHYYKVGTSGQEPSLLGTEQFDGVEEVLLPEVREHKVFFVKKFSGELSYRWVIEEVIPWMSLAQQAYFEVYLSEVAGSRSEEYLAQTLKKLRAPANRRLGPGVLVEVDFGFTQSVGRGDGSLRTNKRYSDTLQHGEMRKRRLAVVVKAEKDTLQVVPVTSIHQPEGIKTVAKLSTATLSDLSFYGSSGKDSWVLCSMVETVSTRRILPPMSRYFDKRSGREKHARDIKYSCKVSNDEWRAIRTALERVIGIEDYDELKRKSAEVLSLKRDVERLEAHVASQQAVISTLDMDAARLRKIEQIAKKWDESLGGGQLDIALAELGQQASEEA